MEGSTSSPKGWVRRALPREKKGGGRLVKKDIPRGGGRNAHRQGRCLFSTRVLIKRLKVEVGESAVGEAKLFENCENAGNVREKTIQRVWGRNAPEVRGGVFKKKAVGTFLRGWV